MNISRICLWILTAVLCLTGLLLLIGCSVMNWNCTDVEEMARYTAGQITGSVFLGLSAFAYHVLHPKKDDTVDL